MRRLLLGMVLTMAGLLPKVGNAQVYQFKTPPPPVTAQYAPWQFNDEPIIVHNLIYYPTRETRFFDGGIMEQIGIYRSVPVYADATLEPWSVVYVPVGRSLLRGYERRREGELAGTQGSRVPAFPVDIPSGVTPIERTVDIPSAVATDGRIVPVPARESRDMTAGVPSVPARTHVESIPAPAGPNGVWLEFEGSRWYADGPASPFDPDRFTTVGDYRGFPVYREKNGRSDAIWVTVVENGPVAPYVKR